MVGRDPTHSTHTDPRGLLHPLPLPLEAGWDDRDGLERRADLIQNHVDLLSRKVHAGPTRSTAAAMDAAIICDMRMRSCAPSSWTT